MGRRAYWPVAQQDRGAGRTNHSCLASYWPDCPQEVRFISWVTSRSRRGLSTGSQKDFVGLWCCQTSSKSGPNMYLKGKTPIRKPELLEAKRRLCSCFQLMQRVGVYWCIRQVSMKTDGGVRSADLMMALVSVRYPVVLDSHSYCQSEDKCNTDGTWWPSHLCAYIMMLYLNHEESGITYMQWPSLIVLQHPTYCYCCVMAVSGELTH